MYSFTILPHPKQIKQIMSFKRSMTKRDLYEHLYIGPKQMYKED
jgi:hypothetical protein